MTKQLLPGTLLIVAALAAACGEDGYYGDDDDQSNNPSNAAGWDGGQQGQGNAQGDAGGWDAARGDGGTGGMMPWDNRFDGGNASGQDGGPWDASPPGWDASPTPDGGGQFGGGGNDSGAPDAAAPDAGGSGGGDAGAVNCATLTYNLFGRQFLNDYCTSCHGAVSPRAGLRLDSLQSLVSRKAGAKSAVLGGSMPQGNKRPSAQERERFGQWMDCGPN